MSVSSVTELVAGKVYALHNTFELNGKISAYPEKARGFSPANCYLLIDEKAAMLLDTGYTAHEGAILEQLDSLLDREMPLSIFPLRINEFMSVCNTMAIAKRFNVVECFSNVPNIEEWVEFETLRGEERNPILKTTLLGRGEQSEVFLGEKRKINVLTAPIRLISTRWIYDESSKILFSSDSKKYCDIAKKHGAYVPFYRSEKASSDISQYPFFVSIWSKLPIQSPLLLKASSPSLIRELILSSTAVIKY